MHVRISFAVFTACLASACGGTGSAGPADAAADGSGGAGATGTDGSGGDDATGTEGGASEGGRADGSTADAGSVSDAGTFACGETFCNQAEVCVHQACGCFVQMPRDGGTCPQGSTTSDAGSCEHSCPGPYCWSPDAGTTLVCDEADGGLSGVFDNLPQGTDLVCYSSCT
jgi:hypothetical protein